jgi:leucyl aminopeptidase
MRLHRDQGTALIVSGNQLGSYGQHLNAQTGGQLAQALQASGFSGKANEKVTLLAAAGQNRITVIGTGPKEKLDSNAVMAAGGTAYKAFTGTPVTSLEMVCDFRQLLTDGPVRSPEAMATHGFLLASYDWKPGTRKPEGLTIQSTTASKSRLQLAEKSDPLLEGEREGIFLARDLATAPANLMWPQKFAERCQQLEDVGVKVTLFHQETMINHRMGGLLAVSQGSARPPVLAVLEWPGDNPRQPPIALIGKGVTFDTGGNNLKTGRSIEDMHYDKAGAATVAGVMNALARRGSPQRVVAVLALTENKIGPNAIEPNSIITMMNGKTIEITNTDAEGRLILADAMTFAQHLFKPRLMIDFATLTGAVGTALGSDYAGLFSNNDGLSKKLLVAGKQTGEPLWSLPLDYHGKLNGKTSDHVNWAGGAGASLGAAFLDLFVPQRQGKPIPHAHIDLAETAWKSSGSPICRSGVASGWGVRMTNRYLLNLER